MNVRMIKMQERFIRVAAATPKLRVASCGYNEKQIIENIIKAVDNKADMIVFPELAVTGYSCGDLFLQQTLLEEAEASLGRIAKATRHTKILIVLGLPFVHDNKLYNTAAFLWQGLILGLVPKIFLPNYGEFYEKRYFSSGAFRVENVFVCGQEVSFGGSLLFACQNRKSFIAAAEICEDLWAPIPPSSYHGLAGATVIANLSASNELAGKSDYRRQLVSNQSARIFSAYVYACAGPDESTTDLVYGGHNLIGENGKILEESNRFERSIIYADLDLDILTAERLKHNDWENIPGVSLLNINLLDCYKTVYFSAEEYTGIKSIRKIDSTPFIPKDAASRRERCEEILNIQAYGLMKRLEYINCANVVVGVSGGLDSTLALIVCVRAFDKLGFDRKGIHGITLPGFGTSDTTYQNAIKLIRAFGASFREINIGRAVLQHFEDIGHDPDIHDLTYENSQARERTQILMDIASQVNGFVVGTGDLSELALGFATYNGDHMSMYGVNASIPKTLIRYLIEYEALSSTDPELKEVLLSIMDTPVSPELLPADKGVITQETEKIVGPYILHDFFLYYMLRYGFKPEKILSLAKMAFDGEYDEATISKWLKLFYKRFFANQYKRSCLPDGPKVGSVALSPRGDWRMPSDASGEMWIIGQ